MAACPDRTLLDNASHLLAEAGGLERRVEATAVAAGELNAGERYDMKIKFTCAAVALALAGSGGAQAQAPSGGTVPVTADNFPRAESDLYFGGVVKNGGFSKFDHTRTPAPLDKQTVIRLNRDTLYSAAVFDLDAGPATIAHFLTKTLKNVRTEMSLQVLAYNMKRTINILGVKPLMAAIAA